MQSEPKWTWVIKAVETIPIPYKLTSIFIGISIFLIFYFLSHKVVFFPMDPYHLLEISSLSAMISYQLISLPILHRNLEKLFKLIDDLNNEPKDIFYNKCKHNFIESRWYYVSVFFVVIPFITIEAMRILEGEYILFSSVEPTNIWSWILDIFNHITNYFMLYLLAVILWIVLNGFWAFKELWRTPKKFSAKLDTFNFEEKLKPLLNILLDIFTYYFICIPLALASYITPFRLLSYETMFLITMIIIGLLILVFAYISIASILNNRIEYEIYIINKQYGDNARKFMTAIANTKYNYNYDVIYLSHILSILHKEQKRVTQINIIGYDLNATFKFILINIITFILPMITLIDVLHDLNIIKL